MCRRERNPGSALTGLMLLTLVAWPMAPHAAEGSMPLAGWVPLEAYELDRYRGGFFTVGGWEIAFAMAIEVTVDGQFALSSWFNPLGSEQRSGALEQPAHSFRFDAGGPVSGEDGQLIATRVGNGFRLTSSDSSLRRTGDGSLQLVGDAAADAGGLVRLTGVRARLVETVDGFELVGDGPVPFRLRQDVAGIEQRIGTVDETLIDSVARLDQLSQWVANTVDNIDVRAMTTLTIDVLNHADRLQGLGSSATRRLLRAAAGNPVAATRR